MKFHYQHLLPLAFVLLSAATLHAQDEDATLNDVANYVTYGGSTITVVDDTDAVEGDAFEIRHTGELAPDAPFNSAVQISPSAGNIDRAGLTHTISLRYRADDPRDIIFWVTSREEDDPTFTDDQFQVGGANASYYVLSATTEWQAFSVTLTSPQEEDAPDHYVHLQFPTADNAAPFLIDDINVITEGSDPSNPGDTDCQEGPLNVSSNYSPFFGTASATTVEDSTANCGDAVAFTLSAEPAGNFDEGLSFRDDLTLEDTPGNRYRIALRYRADTVDQAALYVPSRKRAGGDETAYFAELNLTPEWQTLEAEFESPRTPGEVDQFIYVGFGIGGLETTMYIDSFFLEQINETCDPGIYNVTESYKLFDDNNGTIEQVDDETGGCGTAIRACNTGEVTPGNNFSQGIQIIDERRLRDLAGKRFRLTFRARKDGDTPLSTGAFVSSRAEGASEIQAAFISTTITEEWQTFSQAFDSPLEAGQSDRFLHWSLGVGATNDCVYIDDVAFEDITPVRTDNATLYVDTTGSDGNDGLVETRAFRTLSFALTQLIPGDSLVVGDGEYRGQFRIADLIGTAENPTVVTSKNPYGAKLIGRDKDGTILRVINSDFVVVSGFEAYHPGEGEEDWMSAFGAFGSDYVTFRDNYAHDCGCAGFNGREGDYLTYERNVARDNAKNNPFNCSGLSIFQPIERDQAPGPHIIIRDNVLFENECRVPFTPLGFTVPTDGNGIILDDFEQTQTFDNTPNPNPPFLANTLIENNIVFNNGGAGIKSFETANVTIRNNTVYHNNQVLSEFGSNVGDIDLQAVEGSISVYNNIAVKKFNQPGHAVSFAPKDPDNARLLATSNMLVGTIRLVGPEDIHNVFSNLIVSEDLQSYPAFANVAAVDEEVPAFATVDEFTAYFGLRETSAAIDAGTEPTLPNDLDASVEDDLIGRERTDGIDLGALEGPYEGVGDLPPNPTLLAIVNSTPSPMRLDGVEDGFYTSPLQQLTKIIAGNNPTDDDLDATWKGGYDADNLYLYVEVTDDSVASGDRVLILLDGGNEKSDTTDDNDALFAIAADGTSEQVESAAVAVTETGYAVEVAIPWSEISFTPADTSVFGIEIVVEDSDGDEGAIKNRLAWQSTVEGIEGNPSLYGEAELREVAPPPAVLKTTASVELDGELDDAYTEAEAFAIDTEIQPTITDADDLSATWRSVYNEDGLYFYIEVQDDALRSDNPDGEWFQDDGVEIYLDANNSKTFNSYDENDYQIVVRLDGSIFDTKGQLGDGAEASVTETASGYIAEVKLPWTAVGATPAPGLFLGLDVHVIDDDDGGSRDGKLSWFAEIDQSFSNAALFGTVYLAGDAMASNRELPGKVEAETYLEQPNVTVVPSDDDDTDAVVFDERGDYLEYEVLVQETGMYRFTYRVARKSKGLVVFSLNQGDEVLHYGKLFRGTPANEWNEVEAYAYLEEGVQTLRIQSEGRRWKLNWLTAEVVDMNLPGQIEAEAFKERGNRVLVLPSGDADETQAISFLAKGAYVTYPVNITEAGRYTFTYRVRTISKKMEFYLQLNDKTIHKVKAKRLKGSPFGWQEVSATADLPAGEHVLRLLSKKDRGSINWWRAESVSNSNARNANEPAKGESLTKEDQLFSVYPNPSRGSVLLTLPDVERAQVEVYDFQGRTVLQRAIDRPSTELDLQDLSDGLYLIRVKTTKYDLQQRVILEK